MDCVRDELTAEMNEAFEIGKRKGRKEAEACRKSGGTDAGLVYICSPYRGDVERNVKYARELTRSAALLGYIPITPHLYLTEALIDEIPEERKIGMELAKKILKKCSMVIVGKRYGISEGMESELRFARVMDIPEIEAEKFLYPLNGED